MKRGPVAASPMRRDKRATAGQYNKERLRDIQTPPPAEKKARKKAITENNKVTAAAVVRRIVD